MKIQKNTLIEVANEDVIDGKFIVPSGIENIGEYAFYHCTSLTHIELPEVLEWIGDFAFRGCTYLTHLVLPDGIKEIGLCAFEGCTSLTHIKLHEGIESIGYGAFSGCTSLQQIVLPASIRSIGNDVFYGCASLTHIKLHEGIVSIGYGAFRNCTSLTHIKLPEGIEWIGWGAFRNCTSLTHIELPASLVSIGGYAFWGCTSLTHIELPASVRSIGNDAFLNCASLTQIIFPNGETHKHKCIDGYSFLIENERVVGNTIVFKGLWMNSCKNGRVIGDNCFVAEREGFTAHGETIKEAMEDLEFKFVQDRLQNSPLSMDDLIDVNHYRAITGACRIGIAKWMKENNLTQEKILVRDLLPLLEKTNAYGVKKFKKLIQ